MNVWYPQAKPRTTGLRLKPGWNEVPIATAAVLIERGIVVQEPPGSASEKATEDESESSKEDEPTAGRRKRGRRGRRMIE